MALKAAEKIFLEAAEEQDKEGMEKAIADGVDVTVDDEGGMNALGIAAKYGNLGMADFLAETGVPVTNDVLIIAQMTERDTTPQMMVLLQSWQMKQMKPDIKGMKKPEAHLICAADEGKIAGVDAALKKGANINALDGLDTTPLRWAIRKGHSKVATHLVKKGADVNHVSSEGWTALMEAGASGEEVLVRMLLKNKADAGFTNESGQNAAMVTRYGGFDALADVIAAVV